MQHSADFVYTAQAVLQTQTATDTVFDNKGRL